MGVREVPGRLDVNYKIYFGLIAWSNFLFFLTLLSVGLESGGDNLAVVTCISGATLNLFALYEALVEYEETK